MRPKLHSLAIVFLLGAGVSMALVIGEGAARLPKGVADTAAAWRGS